MLPRKQIEEFELLELARCGLRQPQEIAYSKPLEVRAIEATAAALLLDAFNKQIADAAAVRRMLDDQWKDLREEMTQGQFERFHRHGAGITRRIGELLTRFRIMQPVTVYYLHLGTPTVTGAYAILQRIRRKDEVLVLRLRSKEECHKEYRRRPDVVNQARWLYLRSLEPTIPHVNILNFSLDSEEEWMGTVTDEDAVRRSLTGLTNLALQAPGFPSPGDYCASCRSEGCMPLRDLDI